MGRACLGLVEDANIVRVAGPDWGKGKCYEVRQEITAGVTLPRILSTKDLGC